MSRIRVGGNYVRLLQVLQGLAARCAPTPVPQFFTYRCRRLMGWFLGGQGEIDGLFEKRKEMELAYMESKQKRQEQYQAEIEALLTRDGEEHTKLKIKLETDIQV